MTTQKRTVQLKKRCFYICLSITFICIALSSCGVNDWNSMISTVYEGAYGCNVVGSAAAKLLGSDNVKKAGVISSSVCAAIAVEMERRRQNAVSREKELDDLIAQEQLEIVQLEKMNNELKADLVSLKQKAIELKAIIASNKTKAIELAANIQNEKEIAVDLLEKTENTIYKVEQSLNGSSLTKYQKETLPSLLILLKDRESVLIEYSEISIY